MSYLNVDRLSDEQREFLQSYTSHRWLYNDKLQQSHRRVEFDVRELCNVGSRITGSKCTTIAKYAEGAFNHIYHLVFQDGQDLIARLPLPMAGPAHLLTCSEVATMDFLRTRLNIPIPKVLAWNSRTDDNPVGSEYIIMERIVGIDANKRLKGLSLDDMYTVIGPVAKYDMDMASVKFSQIGSLFYKEDVNEELRSRPLYAEGMPQDECAERFRVGPSVDRHFYRSERRNMEIDRGPWPDTMSYIRAIVDREIKWMQEHGNTPDAQLQDGARVGSQTHIEELRKWLQLAPFTIFPEASAFTLWHPDLHAANILFDPDSLTVKGVLDWQGACIQPLYVHAQPPPFLAVDNKHLKYFQVPRGTLPVTKPKGWDDLNGQDKIDAMNEVARIARLKVYIRHVERSNFLLYGLVENPKVNVVKLPVFCSGHTWWEGIMALRQCIVRLVNEWDNLSFSSTQTNVECPVVYSIDEIDSYKEEVEITDLQSRLQDRVCAEFAALGITLTRDGEVPCDKISEAESAHPLILQKVLDEQTSDEDRGRIRRFWPLREPQFSLSAERCR